MDPVAPLDIAATLLFATAFLLTLRSRAPLLAGPPRSFLLVALGTYIVVGAFNILQHAGITEWFDRYEDYLEIVSMSFFLVFFYSADVGEELRRRHEVEASLRESERRHRLLVDTIPHGIVECDQDGTITFSNPAHAEMLGYRPEELVGRKVSDLPPTEEERARRRAYIAHIVREQPSPSPYVGRDGTRDGGTREVRVDWDYRRDAQGRVTGFVALVTDVTESRRAEEALLRAQKLESLGVLAGGLAHDFNNLLTAILGNVSLAGLRAGGDAGVTAPLAEAERASLRARDLTQQLTTFAKGGEPVKQPVELERVIRDAASFALSGSNVRCEIRIPPGLRAVEADEGQLSQTLNNLLLNAAQAMPGGGTVLVACEAVRGGADPALAGREGEFVRIVVEDHGVGIPDENLQRIFDPYFSTKERGTGLGLATVYSIVKRHAGEIAVEAVPGGGTRFAICLPAASGAGARDGSCEHRPDAGTGRILVMDDEEQVREVARGMLGSLGYEVDTAPEGARAVAMYREALDAGRPYAAVMLDLTVPGGLGGRETLARLREVDPGVRAVVSSGYSDDPVMADHRAFGFRGVAGKPYTVSELSRALAAALT